MSSQVKVSVVVPVYNTAPYLRQCLDSLIGQTLQDIEVICVDDGSTDDSPAILEEYAAADSRIRVLSQPNSHAGVARNNGMAVARGAYVVFCDSDDYMAPDALELMARQCEADDADICVCAGKRYYEQLGLTVDAPGYLEVKRIPETMPFNRITNAEHIFSFTTIMTWNKMFRLEFLRDHGLRYGDTRNGEDVVICALALWHAQAITVVRKPLVFYRVDRPDSLVGTLNESPLDPLEAWLSVWRSIGDGMGTSKRSFDCKVIGVIRHTFRNAGTAGAFNACYEFLKSGPLDEMDLCPREEGYYYTPWYNGFIAHLREDDRESFLVSQYCTESANLELEEARRLDLRRQLSAVKKRVSNLEESLEREKRERAAVERKFSKVEGVYRAGSATLRPLRRLKRRFSGGGK